MPIIRFDPVSIIFGILILVLVTVLNRLQRKMATLFTHAKGPSPLSPIGFTDYSWLLGTFPQERTNLYFFLMILTEALLNKLLQLALPPDSIRFSGAQVIHELTTEATIKIGMFSVSLLFFWAFFVAVRDLSHRKSMILGWTIGALSAYVFGTKILAIPWSDCWLGARTLPMYCLLTGLASAVMILDLKNCIRQKGTKDLSLFLANCVTLSLEADPGAFSNLGLRR